MKYLHQIQRGVDYIEARFDEDVDLRQVSKAAGISHAHFQRIFKALTGETLATYVRSRRMANALDLLLSTDQRILDIAFAAGFESQEAFARAFKKAFGMTPTAYRSLGRGPDLELYGPQWSADGADSVMHYAIPIPIR